MPVRDEIKNFYTWGSFLSLSVSAGAIWTVLGALSHAFDWAYPKYVPFILAVIFSVFGDLAAKNDSSWISRLPLWFLNGCLIYVTAVGGTYVAGARPEKGTEEAAETQLQDISRQIETIAQLPSASESEEIRALRAQAVGLQSCLKKTGDASFCRQDEEILSSLVTIEPLGLTPTIEARLELLKTDAIQLSDFMETASGEVGFRRIVTSLDD